MPAQNLQEIKERILRMIRIKGPSLPVHIAKEINQSTLFTSAFLSELLSERRINVSHLRVGSSPVYFIQGQEPILEKFSSHLKSKEKDAFALLKERRILNDEEQDPAIRVALRAIKDFAIPFERRDKLFWRYLTVGEPEFAEKQESPQIQKQEETIKQESETIPEKKEILEIFAEEKKQETKKIKKNQKKKIQKKPKEKNNEKFFNRIKDFLLMKKIEILGIESFSKNDLVLKVKTNSEERLLVAYNKKRINESDIINAYKKSKEANLTYLILSLGETPKRLSNTIEAVKNLERIEKIE